MLVGISTAQQWVVGLDSVYGTQGSAELQADANICASATPTPFPTPSSHYLEGYILGERELPDPVSGCLIAASQFQLDLPSNNDFANGQSSLLPIYNPFPIIPARQGLAPHNKHC